MINSRFVIQTGQEQFNTLGDFAARSGMRKSGERNVHFIRAVGVSGDMSESLKVTDRQLDLRMRQAQGHYIRINSLPQISSQADILFYSMCLDEWQQNEYASVNIHSGEGKTGMAELLGDVLRQCADHFCRVTSGVTPSMERNFLIKLLFWADKILMDYPFDGAGVSGSLIYRANGKKQEYLLGYFMAMAGLDVLMLLPEGDAGLPAALLTFSDKIILGAHGSVILPEYVKSTVPQTGTTDSLIKSTTPQTETTGSRPRIPISAVRRPERDRKTQMEQSRNTNRSSSAPEKASPSKGEDTTVTRQELSYEELARLAASVVMIAIHDPGGKVIGTGSGIMVGRDGYILTNNHVARGGSCYSVRIEDDERIYQTDQVIKYHPLWDLALIRIDRKLEPLQIYRGTRPLVRGQRVVAIGSPLGLFNSVSDGIISGFRRIDQVDMIQFTAPTSRGSSGGAVLNMYGEVIGISTAGMDDGQNINLAIGYECVRNFAGGFLSR